jgi:hypothetical protein
MASRADQLWAFVGEGNIAREFAVDVYYSDGTLDDPVLLENVLVTREEQSRRPNKIGGWDAVTTRTARLPIAEILHTIRLDGKITIDSVDYSIENIAAVEGQRKQLSLKRVDIGELTRPTYRQQ